MKYTDENKTCVACGVKGVDLHHIKHRGAGGTDDEFNLLPTCRKHHSRIHSRGLVQVAEENPGVMQWLLAHGWELTFTFSRGKWQRKAN
jgi:hypothetical protein